MEEIFILNFSGVYESEDFYQGEQAGIRDLKDLPGTSCYCDCQAQDELRKVLRGERQGLCFLDSGNYHYVTKLRLERIQEPFELLLFDRHTDMQPPAFGQILSCGGWVREALETLPLLKRVYLAGPPRDLFQEEAELIQSYGDRVLWLEERELTALEPAKAPWAGEEKDLPLFISVDKDLLRPEDAVTNWDQGSLKLDLLERLLEAAGGRRILGMDVCGENPEQGEQALRINSRTNRRLVDLFRCFSKTAVPEKST